MGACLEFADVIARSSRSRLGGEYYIESRRLGARSLDPQKYERDRDLLLAEVDRDPDDSRSAFYLAQSYFDLGDFDQRARLVRAAGDHGWCMGRGESSFCFSGRLIHVEARSPWPDVQDAFLRAWEFRPTRAEPLLDTASYGYRLNERYRLGYLFAGARSPNPTFPSGLIIRLVRLHLGRRLTSRRCAHPGLAGTRSPSRCGGARWPGP